MIYKTHITVDLTNNRKLPEKVALSLSEFTLIKHIEADSVDEVKAILNRLYKVLEIKSIKEV